MQRIVTSVIQLSVCLIFTLGILGQAQEKKVDPNGTWKWSVAGRDGTQRESTLKLKLDGDKLTGMLAGGRGGEVAIEEAKLKADEITFQLTREFNGNKVVTKYNGKISGDTIKGKTEFTNRNGEAQSRDWEAKRETAKAKDPAPK